MKKTIQKKHEWKQGKLGDMCKCGKPMMNAIHISRLSQKEPEERKRVFRQFYNTNENGGSSRWLVAPSVVEAFVTLEKEKSYHQGYYEGLQMGKKLPKKKKDMNSQQRTQTIEEIKRVLKANMQSKEEAEVAQSIGCDTNCVLDGILNVIDNTFASLK